MKIFNIVLIFFSMFIASCSDVIDSSDNANRKIDPGNIPINYYADKTVKSLIVPPDLTKPNAQNSFRISEYANNVNENIIDFSGSDTAKDKITKILDVNSDVSVQKSGQRRWLVINKNSDVVWELTKDFLKRQGFVLKKSNKKIGIIETDFLENYPEIPDQNLGLIRSMLNKALTARYTLPIIDKYRVRIEPLEANKTELHLSLFSMKEKLAKSGNVDSTIWEAYEKDYALETEMLYRLMVFISGDNAGAKEKIINAKENKVTKVSLKDNFNGYARLTFELGLLDTWDNVNWALDQLNIDIEDKDVKEKSFYVNTVRTSDLGILSTLLGTDALVRTFQIILKSESENKTDVFFNDISGENEQETKDFSYEFFRKIQNLY